MLFASYSSADRERIGPLLTDIQALGSDVWIDEELSGGQVWWDEILSKIRACEAFLFLVSPSSVSSEACLAELAYADALERTIIPVEILATNPALLPSLVGRHQIVSYVTGDKADTMAMARALARAGPPGELPRPEPPRPPLPGAYFTTLRDQINVRDPLTLEQQLGVLHRLRARASDDAARDEILVLLRDLRRRDDLYASVAEQADALRASVQRAAPTDTAPAPRRLAGLRGHTSLTARVTIGLAAASVVAGLLALRNPQYKTEDSVVDWEGSARWVFLVLVGLFGVLVVLSFATSRRVRVVASVLVLVVALVGFISWWAGMDDILHEREIATNSGPISLGPGMSWSGLCLALQVIVGVLVVLSAFDKEKSS